MPLDPTVKGMLKQLAESDGPAMVDVSPAEARQMYRVMQSALPAPEIREITDASAADIPIRIYCFPCYWTRCSYLGVYFRNISKSFKSKWPVFWLFNTLGVGSNYSFIGTHTFFNDWSRSCVFSLCYNDGFPVVICNVYDA